MAVYYQLKSTQETYLIGKAPSKSKNFDKSTNQTVEMQPATTVSFLLSELRQFGLCI